MVLWSQRQEDYKFEQSLGINHCLNFLLNDHFILLNGYNSFANILVFDKVDPEMLVRGTTLNSFKSILEAQERSIEQNSTLKSTILPPILSSACGAYQE